MLVIPHLRTLTLSLLLAGFSATLVSQQAVTLRISNWADLEESKLDKEVLAEFERLNPTIKLLYEPNPGRQYEEKILSALAAGEPPDVFLLDSKLIPTFTDKHVLLDLNPFVGKLGIDTSIWFSNVADIARRGTALYAFPKGFTPMMVYYNKRLLNKGALPEPPADWNWNDYLRYAKALTLDENSDGTPEQYGGAFTNFYYSWIPWVWTGGGDVVDPAGMKASGSLNSPSTESALQFLIDLRNVARVAPDVGSWVQAERTGMNAQLFLNGKIGMIVTGHWSVPAYLKHVRQGTIELGVAPLPRHPSGSKMNVMYESGWCVPVNSNHPNEATVLAAFLSGEFAARVRSRMQLEIPSVKSAALEMVANDLYGIERSFVDEVAYCRQPWGSIIERFSEIEWTLQDAVDEVMLNGKPMHETMTAYAARIDAELANIRSTATTEFKPINEHSEILRFLLIVTTVVLTLCIFLYARASRSHRAETAASLSFIAPSLVHLTVFVFTPIIFSAYLSVHRWDMVVPNTPFIGLENFREIFSDQAFWNALKNTFLFTLNVPAGMAIALIVAVLLHRRTRGVTFLRALYFLPSVTSFVAIALVWMWIYHPSFGIANILLTALGLPPAQWLNSTQTAMLSVVIFSVWLGLGYQMVIFLAGLQGISEELYDAARIDGANNRQQFWRITLPLLKPTTFFILITSLISSFQVFTSIYVLTAGGPVGSTDVIVYHIYKAGWEQLRMGYASALSWILFLIIMSATWLQFRMVGRDVEYT
jgi:multiple sugar transport system permease protein